MRILVFGGTTEGRLLAHALAEAGQNVTVSVATPLGAEELGCAQRMRVLCGRLSAAQMKEMLEPFDLCVDATHPYATEVSANIRTACRAAAVPLRRVRRQASEIPAGSVVVPSAEAAATFLEGTQGNVLLTTGAKELHAFSRLERSRLYARVLPVCESIITCEREQIPHGNILALQGPFSRQLNEAMLQQFSIAWLVTKDGGAAGGFSAKVEAARSVGARLVLIRRPEEEGEDWQVIVKECLEQ